jgi:hypothetical protein
LRRYSEARKAGVAAARAAGEKDVEDAPEDQKAAKREEAKVERCRLSPG